MATGELAVLLHGCFASRVAFRQQEAGQQVLATIDGERAQPGRHRLTHWHSLGQQTEGCLLRYKQAKTAAPAPPVQVCHRR